MKPAGGYMVMKERRNRRYVPALLLLILLANACTKELKLPDIGAKKQVVLLGELIAGDTVHIRGGQSVPLSNGSTLEFETPSGLGVEMSEMGGTSWTLNGYADKWTRSLYTMAFSLPRTIVPGYNYQFSALSTELGKASCNVTVPLPFAAAVLDTQTVLYSGSKLLRAQVQVYDDAGAKNYYVIEAVKKYMSVDGTFTYNSRPCRVSANKQLYDSLKKAGTLPPVSWDTTFRGDAARINIYTDDEATENIKLSNALSLNRRILLTDETFKGQAYTTRVYLDKTYLHATADTNKGQLVILIKSVSPEYFNYLKYYEMYEPSTGFTSLSQPVKIEGNITGGLGMIGGVYQHQYCYLFDRWY
jgi:hypothetical protein